jgi:rRNA maturation protein Nop10
MKTLSPCPSCERHVRDEEACPFCGAELRSAAPSPPDPKRGLRRAAMLAVSAVLVGGGAIDCGSTVTDQKTAAGTGTGAGGDGTGVTTGAGSTASSTGGEGGTNTTSVASSSNVSSSSSGGTGGSPSTSSGGGFLPPYGAPPT